MFVSTESGKSPNKNIDPAIKGSLVFERIDEKRGSHFAYDEAAYETAKDMKRLRGLIVLQSDLRKSLKGNPFQVGSRPMPIRAIRCGVAKGCGRQTRMLQSKIAHGVSQRPDGVRSTLVLDVDFNPKSQSLVSLHRKNVPHLWKSRRLVGEKRLHFRNEIRRDFVIPP